MAAYPSPPGVTVKSEPLQYDEQFELTSVPWGDGGAADRYANDPSRLQGGPRGDGYIDPYVCRECDIKFNSDYYAWRSHSFLVHGKDRKYMCNLCGQGFEREVSLQNHMMHHDGQESGQLKFRYKCEVCGYRAMQMAPLKTHRWVVHQRADDVDWTIINGAKDVRQENKKASSDFEFVAVPVSGYNNVTSDGPTTDPLEGNEKMTYQLGSLRPFSCGVCDYRTTQLRFLQRHVAKHTVSDLSACIEWGFESNEDSQLEPHLQVSHTEEKPTNLAINVPLPTSSSFPSSHPVARNDMAAQEVRHSLSPPKDDQSRIPKKAAAGNHISPWKPPQKYFKSSPRHLTCNMCDFETDEPSYLETHVCMEHSGMKALVSSQRDFRSTEESDLNDDMTEAHPKENSVDESYSCEFCSRKCRTSEELAVHMAAGGPNKCQTCKYKSSSRCAMETHRKTHSEMSLTCRQCSFICETVASMMVHAKVHAAAAKHEKIEELNRYGCSMCDFRCSNVSVLKFHMKVAHLKKASVHLKAEENVSQSCESPEGNLKPIVKIKHCKICNREFATDAELANHMVPGKYICGVCNFVSCYKCALRAHKKSHDEKVFCCGFSGCDFVGNTAASLIIHKRLHKN